MAIVTFPSNPTDGMLFEPTQGMLYRYNSREKSWIRIDTTTVGLATPISAGVMSKEDFKKLQGIILPPPQSTLHGEDCDITFDGGVVSLYSTDGSVFVEDSLTVGGTSQPWQIHENTAGYNFKLNLEQFVEEIESRGKYKKVQVAGKDGLKGVKGEPGRDYLETGPEGDAGVSGINAPFQGSFIPESAALVVDESQGDRAIVDITTEQVSDDENYLVVTRANIGNPDACPATVSPRSFDSPWVLVLDQKETNVTRRMESAGDNTITCRICVSQVYYLNIETIIETVQERYQAKLFELKFEKERVIGHWLKVMASLFNEQKYALCCALENCSTRKRNQDVRRYIEQSRIQAAIAGQAIVIDDKNKNDRVTVNSDQKCNVGENDEEIVSGGTDSRVVYGQECDQYLVTMSLDARIHNKDPRSGINGRWLEARLAPGDYMVEVLDCCANFGKKIKASPQIHRSSTPPPPPPSAPAAWSSQPTQFIPQGPVAGVPASAQQDAALLAKKYTSTGKVSDLYAARPSVVTDWNINADNPVTTVQQQNPQYNVTAGFVPGSVPFGSAGPGGRVNAGLRTPFSNTAYAGHPQVGFGKGCNLDLTGVVGISPGDIPTKGYVGYIGPDCRIAHGYANSMLVQGCTPICQEAGDTVTPVVDSNLSYPNKYTGHIAILHYGVLPGQNVGPIPSTDVTGTGGTGDEATTIGTTGDDVAVEKITEIPAAGPNGGFFQDLFAAKQAYIGLSTIFSHAGGNIKVWIPDPDNISANNDGGVVIGVRSRRCVEELASDSGTTTQLPTIYIYRDNLDPQKLVGSIKPYITDLTHIANYGLAGGNANLTTGPVLEPEVSKTFFVMASDGLGFYHIHHTNDPAADSFSTTILSKYKVESNTQTIEVDVEDDAGSVASAMEHDGQMFTAAWTFDSETAGLVLNQFGSDSRDDWVLTLDETNFGDIKKLISTGVDGEELILSQGSLGTAIPAQSEAEPFILCRALTRSCNVPVSLGKRYSLGIVNRVQGVNFRICRTLLDWTLDSWLRRPFIYAPSPYPCGSSFCDVKYQVINGSDGQFVPINMTGDQQVRIDGSKVNIAFVVDQSASMTYEYSYLSQKIDDLTNFILGSGVNHLATALVTYGSPTTANSGNPVLRQDFTEDIPTIVEAINDSAPLASQALEASPGLWATQWTVDNVAWEDDAVKIIVLITDKDSTATAGITKETVFAALQRKKIILNGIVKLQTEKPFESLLCESWSFVYTECDAGKPIGEAWVIDRHSVSTCVWQEGESINRNGNNNWHGTFGITSSGKLWTDHGARATFGIRYREDIINSTSIQTQYGTPNDASDPSVGGTGLCYDTGGALFSISELRKADINDEVLVFGASLTQNKWDSQPFKNLRLGIGSAAGDNQPGIPGFPMPFDLTELTVEDLRSSGWHLIVGKFEGGLPPHNPPIAGGLVNLRSDATGNKVIATAITDDSGRYAFMVPVDFFPRRQVSFFADLQVYNMRFGGPWAVNPYSTHSNTSQGVIVGDGVGVETLYAFANTHDAITKLNSSLILPDTKFTIRGMLGDTWPDHFQKVINPRVTDGKFVMDIGFDDTGEDLDYDDLIVRLEHPLVDCLPASGSVSPITTITQKIIIDDLATQWYGAGDRHLSFGNQGQATGFAQGSRGSGITSAGIRAFTNEEITKLNSKFAECGSGGFLQKFANLKLREIQAFAPVIDATCTSVVNGGPSTVYSHVSGIKMTQATLDGTIQAVQATLTALPGTAVRATIYDKQGRGIVMRSIATYPTQAWETRSWQVGNIDHYINYDANTVDVVSSLQTIAPVAAPGQTTNQPQTYAYTTVARTDVGSALVAGDSRSLSVSGRTDLLTGGLSIKLSDLANISFEFINPDTGIICYFADVKVAVERVKNQTTGATEVVMVDIANFEPFGETLDEPGEIPLTVYAGAIESTGGSNINPGTKAIATLTLSTNPVEGNEILLGGTHREGDVIHGGSQAIWLRDTFITDPHAADYPGHQVKIGATPADTLTNICNFINGVGTQNGTWHNALAALGLAVTDWASNSFIECLGTTATTATFGCINVGLEGNSYQAREVIDINDSMSFGLSNTFAGGTNAVDGPVLITSLATTEDDVSAYLENFWSIAMPDTPQDPNTCLRVRELCPDCVVVKCDRSDVSSVLRQEIDCISKSDEMHVPLTKYLFTPIAPCESCQMHWKQVEWYERGWRIGACCGAYVEVDGQQWLVVKRSIGVDTSCGGGESEHTECIRQFVDSGRGHPAIAWPTVDGEEFIGRPHSGFVRFTLDPAISDAIINAISKQEYNEVRGNLNSGNVADTIPFVLFPRIV